MYRKCETCECFCPFLKGDMSLRSGTCHKEPPKRPGQVEWPVVMANDFCGGYQNDGDNLERMTNLVGEMKGLLDKLFETPAPNPVEVDPPRPGDGGRP